MTTYYFDSLVDYRISKHQNHSFQLKNNVFGYLVEIDLDSNLDIDMQRL